MNITHSHKAALAGVLLLLVACGGGGGGSSTTPPTVTGPVTTDLQARTLAARSANALFAYENMNSVVLIAALRPLPIGAGLTTSTYAVPCAAGTGSTAFNDADATGTFSTGDAANLAVAACQADVAFPWVLGGSVPVVVVGGNNVEQNFYNGAAGSAQVSVTHAGTTIGANRTVTGSYLISTSNTANGVPLDQAIAMSDLTIAHSSANLHITGLAFTVVASSSIASAAGNFATTVSGIGNVQLALSVKSALTIDSSTARFRPSAGTLTLTATDYSLDVQYGAGGTVTIRVDNGRDGSVDRTVSTTEVELDSLLTTP